MSVAVDVGSDGGRSALGRERVTDIARGVLRAEGVRHALISISFLSPRRIAELNARHLAHRGPTDVISFGFSRASESDPVVGDIYICPAVAQANAIANGTGIRQETARLIVHGVLHVLGYDHPETDDRERSAMWKRQETLLRRLYPPRSTRGRQGR